MPLRHTQSHHPLKHVYTTTLAATNTTIPLPCYYTSPHHHLAATHTITLQPHCCTHHHTTSKLLHTPPHYYLPAIHTTTPLPCCYTHHHTSTTLLHITTKPFPGYYMHYHTTNTMLHTPPHAVFMYGSLGALHTVPNLKLSQFFLPHFYFLQPTPEQLRGSSALIPRSLIN